MTGRNAWDTTPEEPEPEIEVEVIAEVPIEAVTANLRRKVGELEAEQQEFYMVTRQHQIDGLLFEIMMRTRGETGG